MDRRVSSGTLARAALAALAATAAAFPQPAALGPADYREIEGLFLAAKRHEAAGELHEAASRYRQLLGKYPSAVPRAYHNLGLVQYRQRDYPGAILTLEKGLALDANMWPSRLFLGMAYLYKERPESALPHLEAAHARQPGFESGLALGQAYQAHKLHEKAIQRFEEALPLAARREDEASALYSTGQAYLKLAESIANRQSERFPESKDTYVVAAKLFESQRGYQIAAIKYLEASELDPMNASIFFPLARMLAILGLEAESRLALERYWDLLPSVPRTPIDRQLLPREQVAEIGTKVDFGGILRSLPPVAPDRLPPLPILPGDINSEISARLSRDGDREWAAAVEAVSAGRFREALGLLASLGDPGERWLRDYLLASVHVLLDDYRQAARVSAGRALSESSSQAAQVLRAEVFRQTSIEYFDRLVREHPDSCRTRLVRAMNFASREMEEAEAEFLAAIEACPFDTEIRIELADYYLSNSRYVEARDACAEELAIHPHSSAAKKRLGRIHVQLREADKALPYLTAAAEADSEDPDVRSDMGRAYELIGKTEEAVAQYRLALELNPGMNRVHYVLARLYRQLGRDDQARAEFERFKQNEEEERQARVARIQRLRQKDAPETSP